MQHHLAAIPVENLQEYYSQHQDHASNRSPDVRDLFKKFVEDGRGRGGNGLQHNIFFWTVLKSLGYDVCLTGARSAGASARPSAKVNISEVPDILWYIHLPCLLLICKLTRPRNHTVIILILDSSRYLIDMGLGQKSTIYPVPLTSGLTLPTIPSMETQLLLVRVPVRGGVGAEDRKWVYRVRWNPNEDWRDVCSFIEPEYPTENADIYGLYEFIESNEPLREVAYCHKMIMTDGELVGSMEFTGRKLERRVNGRDSEILETCLTEEQRVESLERYLGIVLTLDERNSIRGSAAELRG